MASIADQIGAAMTQLQQAQTDAIKEYQDLLAARADDQTQLTRITDLTKQVADLQAKLNGQVTGQPVVTEFSGFTLNSKTVGVLLPLVTVGKGRDVDIRRMKPSSSTYTRGTEPLSSASPPTNQLQVFRHDGGGKSGGRVSDMTMEITEQGGEFYHVLNLVYSLGTVVERLLLRYVGTSDIGGGGSPPLEVFGLATNHADGLTLNDVIVDLAGHGASVVGVNNQKGFKSYGGVYKGAKFGMGITFWQVSDGIYVEGADLRGNMKPANFENNGQAGEIRLKNVDFRNHTHATCATIRANNGSADIIFEDPILDDGKRFVFWGPWKAGSTYLNKPQTQKLAQVRVLMGGKDVTNDTTKVEIQGR